MTQRFEPKKVNGFQFFHPAGRIIAQGWGVWDNERQGFLTASRNDPYSPYTPAGGKRSTTEVANTLPHDTTWEVVKPL